MAERTKTRCPSRYASVSAVKRQMGAPGALCTARAHALRRAKVRELDVAVEGDEDVLGLKVAGDQAERVHVVEGTEDLAARQTHRRA